MRDRVLHGLERLREEMHRLDAALEHPVDAYLIGGCAMSYAGLKNATKDIDLILPHGDDFKRLRDGLLRLSYEPVADPGAEYEEMGAAGYYEREGAPQWDLFVQVVCNKLQLSPGMRERSVREEPELERLRIHRLHPGDIFIFKSITGRVADREDMDTILAQGINWDMVLEEMRWQSHHSQQTWTPAFAQALQELADEGRGVPILPELREVAEREMGERKVLDLVQDGASSMGAVVEAMGEEAAWVESLVTGLVERGRLQREGDSLRPGRSA